MLRISCFLLFISLICGSPTHDKLPLKASHRNTGRIVNGLQAVRGQFPWQAALYVQVEDTTYFCGGVIIDPEWIITSGACLDEVESAQVQTGIVDIDHEGGNIIDAAEIILHEEFDPWILEHSIGLIRLSTPLEFDDNTQAVALADDRVGPGVEAAVSGWGAISDDVPSLASVLNYAYLNTIDNDACGDIFGHDSIFEENLCAISVGAVNRGPCAGDTGGPLVASINTSPRLIGVVDFISDHGCEAGHPAGFTRISSYRDWIREKSGL